MTHTEVDGMANHKTLSVIRRKKEKKKKQLQLNCFPQHWGVKREWRWRRAGKQKMRQRKREEWSGSLYLSKRPMRPDSPSSGCTSLISLWPPLPTPPLDPAWILCICPPMRSRSLSPSFSLPPSPSLCSTEENKRLFLFNLPPRLSSTPSTPPMFCFLISPFLSFEFHLAFWFNILPHSLCAEHI